MNFGTDSVALPPCEQIAPSLVVDTAAYSIGDSIGGKLTITNAMRIAGGRGVLQSLFIADVSNSKPQLEILIFNDNPTVATITDQAAVVLSTDISKVIRRIPVYPSDYVTINNIAIADLSPGGRILKAVTGSINLYAAIVSMDGKTFAHSTDLTVKFGMLRD